MSARVFVDTNVLVYARDSTEPEKQARAGRWMQWLWRRRAGRLSFQVLNEYYVTVTTKLTPGLQPDAARADLRALMAWRPVAATDARLEAAWRLQDRFGLSWWDAQIVAAAQQAGCSLLLSEDLQHGQELAGVEVRSPFRSDVDEPR